MGYPGIVLDDAGDELKGHLFCSSKLDEHWDELDAFEGAEYERVLVKAKTKDNKAVAAYISYTVILITVCNFNKIWYILNELLFAYKFLMH